MTRPAWQDERAQKKRRLAELESEKEMLEGKLTGYKDSDPDFMNELGRSFCPFSLEFSI